MPLESLRPIFNSDQYDPSAVQKFIAAICLGWYCFILLVSALGTIQLRRFFSSPPPPAVSPTLPSSSIPHITIIRPVKGLDSELFACLASTFYQTYPSSHLTIFLCVSSSSDLAIPILEHLISRFSNFDVQILIEDHDPMLAGPNGKSRLGPNPKIRNLSRAYREAKGDIIWVLDCNVWVGRDTAGRMVDRLEGFDGQGGFKFVHLLPIVVDTSSPTTNETVTRIETTRLLEPQAAEETLALHGTENGFGTRLEEAFFSSSHAKFYSAINTVLVAPCIVGKSNMYHKSHLDALTPRSPTSTPSRNKGLDYFSDFICEDHLVGDMLWKNQVPSEKGTARKRLGKHSLVYGSLAIQPIARMSAQEYIARRVRWLRVRKFTVILATFVEPGTESILCSLYGAYGLTTFLPTFPLPLFSSSSSNGWLAFALVFLLSIAIWMQVDRYAYLLLLSGATIKAEDSTPAFAKGAPLKPYRQWMKGWIGRELLACPIWTWAFWCGTKVVWRGQSFKVGVDMRAKPCSAEASLLEPRSGSSSGKSRSD